MLKLNFQATLQAAGLVSKDDGLPPKEGKLVAKKTNLVAKETNLTAKKTKPTPQALNGPLTGTNESNTIN